MMHPRTSTFGVAAKVQIASSPLLGGGAGTASGWSWMASRKLPSSSMVFASGEARPPIGDATVGVAPLEGPGEPLREAPREAPRDAPSEAASEFVWTDALVTTAELISPPALAPAPSGEMLVGERNVEGAHRPGGLWGVGSKPLCRSTPVGE